MSERLNKPKQRTAEKMQQLIDEYWEAKGLLSRLGATHSVDLPLLFEDFLKPFRSVYLGVLPDPARQQLAIRMRDRWMAFVNGGPPGDDWPAYRSETRETLVLSARRDRVVALFARVVERGLAVVVLRLGAICSLNALCSNLGS